MSQEMPEHTFESTLDGKRRVPEVAEKLDEGALDRLLQSQNHRQRHGERQTTVTDGVPDHHEWRAP